MTKPLAVPDKDELRARCLSRSLAATNFDETFAPIDEYIAAVDIEEAHKTALAWCASDHHGTRAAGLDLLGVVTQEQRSSISELVDEVRRLPEDADEELRWSAAHALSGFDDAIVLDELLRFEIDPDSDIRWQVVYGLPDLVLNTSDPDDPALRALLRLTEDPDAGVRDWAAFGLNERSSADSVEIRDALVRMLFDVEGDGAGEAAVALARRGDPRVLPFVRDQLNGEHVGNLWVEAAADFGDPSLLPSLRRLKHDSWDATDPRGELLDLAISRLEDIAAQTGR